MNDVADHHYASSSTPEAAPSRPFAAFLARSMEILREEQAPVHRRLLAALASKELCFRIDDETTVLRFDAAMEFPAAAERPHVRIRTGRRHILRVLDGTLTLEDAIRGGDIDIAGRVEDLVLFHETLMLYLQGAIRCPGFPSLMDRYRRGSSPHDRTSGHGHPPGPGEGPACTTAIPLERRHGH